jgi:hypothetical protein
MRMNFACLPLLLAACDPGIPEDYLVGESDEIAVSLGGCLSCVPVGLLVGARRQAISVYRIVPPFSGDEVHVYTDLQRIAAGDDIALASLDPSILVTSTELDSTGRPSYFVDTTSAGEARLSFTTAAGDAIDTVTVHVAEPSYLELYVDTENKTPIRAISLAVGEEIVVHVRAFEEAGELLDGEGWTWGIDGEHARLWSPGDALAGRDVYTGVLEDAPDFVYVRGESAGGATLVARRGAITAALELSVSVP